MSNDGHTRHEDVRKRNHKWVKLKFKRDGETGRPGALWN